MYSGGIIHQSLIKALPIIINTMINTRSNNLMITRKLSGNSNKSLGSSMPTKLYRNLRPKDWPLHRWNSWDNLTRTEYRNWKMTDNKLRDNYKIIN